MPEHVLNGTKNVLDSYLRNTKKSFAIMYMPLHMYNVAGIIVMFFHRQCLSVISKNFAHFTEIMDNGFTLNLFPKNGLLHGTLEERS